MNDFLTYVDVYKINYHVTSMAVTGVSFESGVEKF